MENLRIKEVAKARKMTYKDIADKMGITYVALNARLKTAKFETLKEIASILNCEVCELIKTSGNFAHFYDGQNQWQGIRKI